MLFMYLNIIQWMSHLTIYMSIDVTIYLFRQIVIYWTIRQLISYLSIYVYVYFLFCIFIPYFASFARIWRQGELYFSAVRACVRTCVMTQSWKRRVNINPRCVMTRSSSLPIPNSGRQRALCSNISAKWILKHLTKWYVSDIWFDSI